MMQTELFQFAYIPAWYEQLDALSQMALPEPWRFRESSFERKNTRTPVLEKYIHSVFRAAAIDHSSAMTPEDADAAFVIRSGFACFNTGLLTRSYKPIYAFFERNRRDGMMQYWFFKGFMDDGPTIMQNVNPLPKKPFHAVMHDTICYFADWPIRVNVEHILQTPENLLRLPEAFRQFGHLHLLLETAVELTRRYAKICPSIIASQLYQGRVQFLMPICLSVPDVPDLAMTVSVMDEHYLGSTCLTPEMAYSNARLLARPTAPWLTSLVE